MQVRATCNVFASVRNNKNDGTWPYWYFAHARLEMRRNLRRGRVNIITVRRLRIKWIMRHDGAPSKADCRAKTERNRPYKVPHPGNTETRVYVTGYTIRRGFSSAECRCSREARARCIANNRDVRYNFG